MLKHEVYSFFFSLFSFDFPSLNLSLQFQLLLGPGISFWTFLINLKFGIFEFSFFLSEFFLLSI